MSKIERLKPFLAKSIKSKGRTLKQNVQSVELWSMREMFMFLMWKERAFGEGLSFSEAKPTHKEKKRYESGTERYKNMYLL